MEWQKSSYCRRDEPMCVEVATDDVMNRVHIHDKEFNDLPTVTSPESFSNFLKGVKAGEFDSYILP